MYLQKTKWTTAKKQEFNGIKYDSKFEAGFAQELELRKRAKDIKDFKAHVKLPLIVNGFVVCDYYIDFEIKHNDGTIEYAETKGWQNPVWKIKWKLLEALLAKKPNYSLTLIQQGKFKAPKLRKLKK